MTGRELAGLIDATGPGLVLYARQYCRTPEDVVMAAFAKLARAADPPGDPVAWLYRVVKHAALDAARADARRRRRERAAAKPEPCFHPDSADQALAVERLEALPDDLREVVLMRLWGNLSFEQMATAIGCSTSTAFRRYEAAISELRTRLGEAP